MYATIHFVHVNVYNIVILVIVVLCSLSTSLYKMERYSEKWNCKETNGNTQWWKIKNRQNGKKRKCIKSNEKRERKKYKNVEQRAHKQRTNIQPEMLKLS